jgi:L,D-peptidoglycan transpeptidase YkuD (ErfK/YbiS/YcfS/YnhG family)
MTAKTHGRLGALDCAATTNEAVYSVPTARKATVNVNLCNRTAASVQIRLMHINGAIGTAGNDDYIEYNTTLTPAGTAGAVLERTAIPMTATHTIGFYSSAMGVTVQAVGVEEDV